MTTTRRGHHEGSVFFDPDRNRWVGKVTLPGDGTGRQRRAKVVGKTKSEVRDKLKRLQAKVDAGLPAGHGNLTVDAFLDYWLEVGLPARTRVKSPNTVHNYRWALGLARPVLGGKTLRALRPEDIEQLLARLADGTAPHVTKPLARNTVGRVRTALVTALRWAVRRELVTRNVAEIAEMPPGARAPKQGRSLTIEQARELLDAAASHRLGALITVGLMLGLRPGELCGLRWIDVDLDEGVLTVNQARKREYQSEEGRRTEVLLFGDPKTPRSRRSLDMPAPVVAALRAHSRRQAAERLKAGSLWGDHGLIFATSIGTPISPSNLRRDVSAITTEAGLGHWSPNELRHSAGSLLSAAGVPLEQIADVLGHTDTRMLERVYRHPVKKTVSAAAEPMERMFGSRRVVT